MHVTTNDAINAFSLLRDHVNENGFLHECYNLGIGALKTVQDGNYQLSINNIPREVLEEIANFDCSGMKCSECKYDLPNADCLHACAVMKARDILNYEQNIKEMNEWMNKNVKN